MEVQVHPMAKVIPRFIQIHMPLLPLHMTAQSRRGVTHILEAQMHPMAVILLVGASAPPANESPHATIEPSALRAAKAYSFEEISV
jgi:hypothetical protein